MMSLSRIPEFSASQWATRYDSPGLFGVQLEKEKEKEKVRKESPLLANANDVSTPVHVVSPERTETPRMRRTRTREITTSSRR